jgi:hypothetical protein
LSGFLPRHKARLIKRLAIDKQAVQVVRVTLGINACDLNSIISLVFVFNIFLIYDYLIAATSIL